MAHATSSCPKCSSACCDHRLLLIPLGDVAADRECALRAAKRVGELTQAVGRARGEHEAVAGLGGVAGGRGADAARRAGDEEDGIWHVRIMSCTIVRAFTSRPAPAATAACSFRREAHVPKGGPDGGDGGRGGDVVLVCDDNLRDLERFRRSAHFKAKRGGHGQGSLRHGAEG